MYILKNLIKPFLLPPGIFILIAIGYGSWCLARKHKLRGFSFLFIGIIAWGLSITPVSDALLKPLEKGFTIPDNPSGDVIIVLGAGTSSERPDPLGKGAPSQKMLPRIIAGARLHRNLGIPMLVSGRGNSRDPEATGVIISRYLIDLGVSVGHIIIENQSKDTAENAAFSARICKAKGFERPILITSAYHMKRAVLCFNDEGLQVLPFPSGFETWKGRRYTWMSYLPDNFWKSSLALYEYIGLIYYRIVHPNSS